MRGCTKHKTDKQKEHFYSSLATFIERDDVFFYEQYIDLTFLEKREFKKILNKKFPQYITLFKLFIQLNHV